MQQRGHLTEQEAESWLEEDSGLFSIPVETQRREGRRWVKWVALSAGVAAVAYYTYLYPAWIWP